MKYLILIFLFLFSFSIMAKESIYFARSAKGLLMGDAYTSIADDEYTLFYNPAILARHKSFSFWPINPTITVSNILDDPDRFSNIGSTTSDFADAIFNYPVHLGVNAAPGLKMGRFGISAIVDNQTDFKLLNEYSPMLDINHRYDRGFIMGYGSPITGDLAVGVSAKYIQRENIVGTYNLLSRTMMDAINAGELNEVLDGLGRTKGSGWGFDFGLDYVKQSGSGMLTMGLAILDIYTILHTDKNDENREVEKQPMVINYGASYSLQASGFGLKFSGDIRNLEQQMEFMKRVRLGTEIMISPALSVLAGYNSGGYSYGIKADTGLINIYAGFYDLDIGERLGQEKSRQAVIYLSLFDFNFDV